MLGLSLITNHLLNPCNCLCSLNWIKVFTFSVSLKLCLRNWRLDLLHEVSFFWYWTLWVKIYQQTMQKVFLLFLGCWSNLALNYFEKAAETSTQDSWSLNPTLVTSLELLTHHQIMPLVCFVAIALKDDYFCRKS